MNRTDDQQAIPASYVGRILFGEYGAGLKERVREIIAVSEAFDGCGYPLMPYLAAWHDREKIIWYEFVGGGLVQLLGCTTINVSRVFREAILDQRVYRYSADASVQEEIVTRQQLTGRRIDLRQEVQQRGQVDAIYKLALAGGELIWLKDQGRIERYQQDAISLSLGCLTDVTKEMEQKDLLEKIGYFDELTGLPKRRILERMLEVKTGEWQRGYIQDFSFLLLDLDFFKAVNDSHGHQAGDFVLMELAEVMLATKRKEDEVGRYGGEEFYGICQGDVGRGMEFADRLRRTIAAHPFFFHGQQIPVTVSIGVAAATELAQLSADGLIALADLRLYRAKQQGRNRVVGK